MIIWRKLCKSSDRESNKDIDKDIDKGNNKRYISDRIVQVVKELFCLQIEKMCYNGNGMGFFIVHAWID